MYIYPYFLLDNMNGVPNQALLMHIEENLLGSRRIPCRNAKIKQAIWKIAKITGICHMRNLKKIKGLLHICPRV